MRKRRWEVDAPEPVPVQYESEPVPIQEEPLPVITTEEAIPEPTKEKDEDAGVIDYSFQSTAQQNKNRTTIAVMFSICTFAIILTAVVTAVLVTLSNSKKQAAQPAVEVSETSDIAEQAEEVHNSIGISSTFPVRDLNNNALPNYNYTESMYTQYFNYISDVTTSSNITEGDKASVVETFVCYMVMTGWNDPSHILNIKNKQEDWYTVVDETFSMEFWVSPTRNVVYQKMWDLTADQLYTIDCQVCNQYGAVNISYSVNEPYNNRLTVDCWDYDTEFVFDLSTLDVIEILSGIPE